MLVARALLNCRLFTLHSSEPAGQPEFFSTLNPNLHVYSIRAADAGSSLSDEPVATVCQFVVQV